MQRLDQVHSYFNEKERRRLNKIARENNADGFPTMTVDEIKLSCLENNGYESPELNDKLYLHFRGFKKIENLDNYTGVKAIWLESNGFQKIENLEPMKDLRCLYLAKNLISNISGLETLTSLVSIDLSNNHLTKLSGLSQCIQLTTLNVSYNALATVDSIRHLQECPALNTLDLTNNRLENDEEFLDVFENIPSLVSLSINGNEITKMASFRKKFISKVQRLGYLDRPIDAQERFFVDGWVRGGQEGEAAAREEWKIKIQKEREQHREDFKAWQAEQAKLRDIAKKEGRSLITEFTEEEKAERAAEASKAAEDERKMLAMGVGKVGAKFWELDGKGGKATLEEAVRILEEQNGEKDRIAAREAAIAEAEDAAFAGSSVATKANITDVEVSEECRVEELDADDIELEIPSDDVKAESNEKPIAVKPATIATHDNDSESSDEAKADSPSFSTEKNASTKEKDLDDEAIRAAARILEREEQAIRDARVAESMAIYKQQLQTRAAARSPLDSKTMKSNSSSAGISFTRSCTWSDRIDPEESIQTKSASERPLYWSENMDIELGKLVKTCGFDFKKVSCKMQDLAKAKLLGNSASVAHAKPELITDAACELRWSQLDATQWGGVNPDLSALDTVFKVCVNPNDWAKGEGHVSQPSYQALSSVAAASAPKYLKPPTSFPSMADFSEDPEDEEEPLNLD